jgi:hypothetical protein
MGSSQSFFCSTMGAIQSRLRFMMVHTISSRTGITQDWLKLFIMGKAKYGLARYAPRCFEFYKSRNHNIKTSCGFAHQDLNLFYVNLQDMWFFLQLLVN